MSLQPSSHPPPRRLAILGLVAFLLLGLLYPILGPALPTLSSQFGLQAIGASWLISLNSAGAVLGVLLAGGLASRWSARQRALLAVMLLGLGGVGLALASNFALALLASCWLGVGFGMLDLTVNVWLSTSYAERSAAMLNLLSASFGVGAVLAPLAVGSAGGNFRLPLLCCVGLAALLGLLLLTMPRVSAQVEAPSLTPLVGRSRLILGGFMGLFLAYVAVEGGVGTWEVTHLQDSLGLTTGAASQISAWFWVAFTLGRLISAPLTLRVAPAVLIPCALILAALSLALAAIPAAAPWAYTLTGLFLAPVFTTGLVWLTQVLPGSAAPTRVFAGAFIGPVVFAPVIGALRDGYGPTAIPLTLMGIALLAFVLTLWLRRV
ncbi:sugar MFS transporter [Deinococcus sp. QL22]|uniref:MFS transporter n=1 Tax=Deinococcus sp. QL22 TaxID=2939437 RepID=UPI00201838BE|nr:MFS transporter [Deinococcus sp. QL22]UQN09629.1 MFS transporter [Deinococcus sp. QL22]